MKITILISLSEANPELTDADILKLSTKTSEEDVRKLTTKYLNIESSLVDRYLSSNRGDVASAAYGILRTWRNTQSSSKEAFQKLNKSLHEAGLDQYTDASRQGFSGQAEPSDESGPSISRPWAYASSNFYQVSGFLNDVNDNCSDLH